MDRVLMITEDRVVLCFESDVPKGAQIIRGPRDLESYAVEQLDETRGSLLKCKVARSASAAEAASLLWVVLLTFAEDPDAATKYPGEVRMLSKFGSPLIRQARRDMSRIYTFPYVPGKDRIKDAKKKKFGVQMQGIIDALVEGGKSSYTEREILEILERDPARLASTRSTDKVFYYLRGRLRGFGFLLYRD